METEQAQRRSRPDAGSSEDHFDVFACACPSRPTLEHITGRWGVLTLGGLAQGPLRFNELARRVDGVSQKMLSQTLQALERDGFVEREVLATLPPHVVYRLTPVGVAVADKLMGLIADLEALMPQVLDAQARYDGREAD
ncbi:helix-turn-helix transcriptional regulator [Streptacidiphilus sp. PB12-B1b]|uniref:winged helix-turn-helix transcriptional regulator n=1 Tax=Streptacidiphilus sp. PB12-B1b TaxID=2705012 RepID=UPI0015FDF621|nr:helix-turn-helix domain-containing protein [Streptacidiphilus sp. PB12-B1b]QMU76658.1 helix-turn-helix transcriptional regulator [Streptacidiphilus sp. PB12-B1b]